MVVTGSCFISYHDLFFSTLQCHPFVRERFSAATEALDVDDSDVLDSLTEPLSESREERSHNITEMHKMVCKTYVVRRARVGPGRLV